MTWVGKGDRDDEGLDKDMEKRGGEMASVGMGTPRMARDKDTRFKGASNSKQRGSDKYDSMPSVP